MTVDRIAQARNDTEDGVQRKFSSSDIERCPPRFSKHLPAVRNLALESSGVHDGLAWVRLASGHTFYSYITHGSLRRQYPYVADTLPEAITEDTFLAAIDAAQRYVTDYAWPPKGLVRSGEDINIIEAGAYLGHKTVRFAEELAGPNGKVLAIEMVPDNCRILEKNILENGLDHIVDVLQVGISNTTGTHPIYSKGRQRNSLVPLSSLSDGQESTVNVDTLNNIIDGWNVRPVDLLFLTVNGAELKALEGFNPTNRDVRAVFVESLYSVDGQANAPLCAKLLDSAGYSTFDTGIPTRIVASRRPET